MADPQRIVVLGIGNPLKKDEGVGVRIVEEIMSRFEFPGHVDVVDAGTMGMSMLPLFAEYDVMIVTDAVDGTGLRAGTVVIMTPSELAPNQVMHSLHDMRFPDVLAAADLVGYETEARIVGVQIEEISADAEIGLTPAVEAALPTAIDAVLSLLAERGVEPRPRTRPSEHALLLRSLRLGGLPGGSEPTPGS
jgi:hydrogenase maturation protease